MLVTCQPQFTTKDDADSDGDGISPTSSWHLAPAPPDLLGLDLQRDEIEPDVYATLGRLRYIFHETHVTTAELHDLTAFVVHKLLSIQSAPCDEDTRHRFLMSEIIRCSLVLYMLIIHGTTYYSHIHFADSLAKRLRGHLQQLDLEAGLPQSLRVWAISVGLASSFDPVDLQWFTTQAQTAQASLVLHSWDDVVRHLENVLWLRGSQPGSLIWSQWQEIFNSIT
jgi:hypothetical protein